MGIDDKIVVKGSMFPPSFPACHNSRSHFYCKIQSVAGRESRHFQFLGHVTLEDDSCLCWNCPPGIMFKKLLAGSFSHLRGWYSFWPNPHAHRYSKKPFRSIYGFFRLVIVRYFQYQATITPFMCERFYQSERRRMDDPEIDHLYFLFLFELWIIEDRK